MENKKFIEDKLLLLTKVAFNEGISGERFYRLSFDDEIIKYSFYLESVHARVTQFVALCHYHIPDSGLYQPKK